MTSFGIYGPLIHLRRVKYIYRSRSNCKHLTLHLQDHTKNTSYGFFGSVQKKTINEKMLELSTDSYSNFYVFMFILDTVEFFCQRYYKYKR